MESCPQRSFVVGEASRVVRSCENFRKLYKDSVFSLLKQVSKDADETRSCLKRIVFVSQTILILLHICNCLSVFLRISFSLSLSHSCTLWLDFHLFGVDAALNLSIKWTLISVVSPCIYLVSFCWEVFQPLPVAIAIISCRCFSPGIWVPWHDTNRSCFAKGVVCL